MTPNHRHYAAETDFRIESVEKIAVGLGPDEMLGNNLANTFAEDLDVALAERGNRRKCRRPRLHHEPEGNRGVGRDHQIVARFDLPNQAVGLLLALQFRRKLRALVYQGIGNPVLGLIRQESRAPPHKFSLHPAMYGHKA